jgi:hypothetical protein
VLSSSDSSACRAVGFGALGLSLSNTGACGLVKPGAALCEVTTGTGARGPAKLEAALWTGSVLDNQNIDKVQYAALKQLSICTQLWQKKKEEELN